MWAKVQHAYTRNMQAHKQILYTLAPSSPLLVPLWLIDVPTCCCRTKSMRLVYSIWLSTIFHRRHIKMGHIVYSWPVMYNNKKYTLWQMVYGSIVSFDLFDIYLEGIFLWKKKKPQSEPRSEKHLVCQHNFELNPGPSQLTSCAKTSRRINAFTFMTNLLSFLFVRQFSFYTFL